VFQDNRVKTNAISNPEKIAGSNRNFFFRIPRDRIKIPSIDNEIIVAISLFTPVP